MSTFLNFAQKICYKLFNKNSSHILEHFYQHTDLKMAKWVSLAVNKNTIADSSLTKELDILTEVDAFSLKIAETKNGFGQQLWQNKRSLCKIQTEHQSPLLGKFNILIDHLIESEIVNFQIKLNENLFPQNFSPAEISQDEKALEWLRVSFQILEKAVIESLTDPKLLFQTLFFFGKNPKSENHEIRLITFNLDIKFELLLNAQLRITIFNDKNESFGSSKIAVLAGEFNFKKREMLDELTKLISVISIGIKIS